MMQMLDRAGAGSLRGERKADTDNPGYLEWERIKQLAERSQPDCGGRGQGGEGHFATDVSLPSSHDYRVIFMHVRYLRC